MKRFLLTVLASFFLMAGSAFAVVDLNTANQAQLESIKGIGPSKAKAIMDYRAKNGPFKSVDDLDKVKGFGKKTIDKMRAEVTVGGSAGGTMSSRMPAPNAGAGVKMNAGGSGGMGAPAKK